MPWFYREYYTDWYYDMFTDHGYYGFFSNETEELIRPDTTYELYLECTDIANNTAIFDNDGAYWAFQTAPAQTSPKILYIQDGSYEFLPHALHAMDLAFDYHEPPGEMPKRSGHDPRSLR